MHDKIVLITGATSGIGKVAAMELGKKGATVIIHGRSSEKATSAKRKILEVCGHERVDTLIADFTSLEEVRQMAGAFDKKYDRLDVLINNAGGVMNSERKETKDGNETTLGVNVLSHFLLTGLLFKKLQASPHARIINLSSEAHRYAKPDFDDIQFKKKYNPMVAYSNSKLYNLLFAREMHRRLVKAGIMNVMVNAMHPGVVATNFALESTSSYRILFKLFRPFLTSPEKGADTIIYLASSPEAAKFSGAYFKNRKIKHSSSQYDTWENAEKLWKMSEKIVGYSFL